MTSPPGPGRSTDDLSPLSPANRNEFPFHRTTSANQRHASRRSSRASSIHSIGNLTGTLQENGRNAISTLLQPPIVRTGLLPHTSSPFSSFTKLPTARDIPPVTLTNIPHISQEDFAPYITQVGALYEQLHRLQDNDDEDAVADRKGIRSEDTGDPGVEGRSSLGHSSTMTRKNSSASMRSEASSPIRRSSGGNLRKVPHGPPPLSTIPSIYFEENFHLENPRTFDVVSERSEVIRTPTTPSTEHPDRNGMMSTPRKALATNAILQEKLSWYMDTIEIHLINSISTASTTFFTALGSLKELHSETADSVARINVLRKELAGLDEEMVTNGMKIAEGRRRELNLQQLNDAVTQLKLITEEVSKCETLTESGELDKALTNIQSVEKLVSGEREAMGHERARLKLRDLRSAVALQGVHNDLDTLRFRIGKAFELQFSDVLIGDLRRHVETVSSQEVLLRWHNAATRTRGGHARSASAFPTYLTGTAELRERILPSMEGLHRAKHIPTAILVYRENVMREIKALIRRPLPSSSDDDNESMMSVSTASGGRHRSNQEKSSVLARNLRAMDAEDAEELLRKVYIGVTETLRRFSSQVKVLLDVASSLSGSRDNENVSSAPAKSFSSSPRLERHTSDFEIQEELHKTLNVSRLVEQAVDVSNEKIVKVLKVRCEQTIRLPLDLFLRYFTLNLYFANECEAISGKSGTALKTVVNGHIRDFVQKHREGEIQKLAQGMESDQWSAKDFTSEYSNLLGQIIEGSDHDAAAWAARTQIWVSYPEVVKLQRPGSASLEGSGTGKEKTRTAQIDDDRFLLPQSAILLLEGVASFLQLTSGIPSMTADIASSLVAYLQLFNSRCTQLILGAGATKSAGLKNITTKHLALASQALSFTATLVPYIREFIRRHAGSSAGTSSLMGEFDKVKRLLQEHQDSIHQKLVEIMSGRASIHAKSMRNLDWDGSEGPHAYMETLAKETTTLHRVLTKHLPEMSIQMIMLPVFSSYKDQIGNALRDIEPKTQIGIDGMLADMELFTSKLGKLEGFEDTGAFLTNMVQGKRIEPPPSAATRKPREDEKQGANDEANNNDQGKPEAKIEASLPKEEEEEEADDGGNEGESAKDKAKVKVETGDEES